ncbi:bifunctional 3-phosphoshikimate 1-carboxyvinyltransferase/cytidylate kinase [Rhizobacter sp. Root1221]|uniref:bifunctional 3-phosphoshikimate 1-carboxyvinyltransferase/cytidylate kinase n=1 Tax=Rhizobacter sp. Root1221 TaxID=1736433 RepID=UPI0006F3E781|nr:bifunctional 3-phosphoshikimate 1-carboxyvinyltransferase/cytidylate kinase [Rhizobacter sp. Root1221]KQV97225.1 cytidylate kinase [Rhizobacter sp. Root1221]
MFTTPFLDLPPLRAAQGTVRLPGSKSISNRVLLLAGLSEGTTVVHDLLDSDDTRVMLDALRALGCGVEARGADWHITGLAGQLPVKSANLFLGNAGTAMRPLTAALAVLAATQQGTFELKGIPRMHERPIGDLIDALRQLGCPIDYLGNDGYPPLRLNAGTGPLDTSAPIRVRGDVSSQFLTALLLGLPLVSAHGPVTIAVDGELTSKPYIEITLNLLARFGIAVQRDGWQQFTIPQGSRYRSPGSIHVEGDASSASYFVALGAIAAFDGRAIRIEGVGDDSIQGDIRFVDAARAMGAQVSSGPGWLEVRRGAWPLKAIDLDCNHIPDAAMTLAVMALFATGTTRLTNIASWRVKETDRIAAMAIELRKLGATVVEGPDFIEIAAPARWDRAAIHTYDDHRVAMCFSLATFNPLAHPAGEVPVRILDPRCVGKTFPDYFETLFTVVEARTTDVPVLAIDGPTASGKGTLASAVAIALGYHFLDSGALYRATALAAMAAGVADTDEAGLAAAAAGLKLKFSGQQIWLGDTEVSDDLRQEHVGAMASRVSVFPAVREALRALQLSHRRLPGLVADGRDMGTVIFPGADLKVFVTASAAVRAERRYKQLISKGIPANIDSLRADLEARDLRDQSRTVAPLKPAEDAKLFDNSELSVDQCVARVLEWWNARQAF